MTNKFQKQLRRLRERQGISQRKLSELCGLGKNTIARYERGERVPSLTDAKRLAAFFGVTLNCLCGEENKFLE